MTTNLRFRAALAASALAPLLLAGCTVTGPAPTDPLPVEPDGGIGTTDPLTLDYPVLTEPATAVPRWRDLGEQLSEKLATWESDCPDVDVVNDDACRVGLVSFVVDVNAIHNEWLSLDDSNWESGEYSGLVALEPTRDATLAARASYEVWGGSWSSDAPAEAEAFHADLTALDEAFTAWRG